MLHKSTIEYNYIPKVSHTIHKLGLFLRNWGNQSSWVCQKLWRTSVIWSYSLPQGLKDYFWITRFLFSSWARLVFCKMRQSGPALGVGEIWKWPFLYPKKDYPTSGINRKGLNWSKNASLGNSVCSTWKSGKDTRDKNSFGNPYRRVKEILWVRGFQFRSDTNFWILRACGLTLLATIATR